MIQEKEEKRIEELKLKSNIDINFNKILKVKKIFKKKIKKQNTVKIN